MKRKTLCWTAAALLAAMLSGCGSQTTAEPANLNQTMLIEKSAKEQTAYSFPNSFTGDWTAQEGKLSIHADAQVVAEQGVVLPVASVTPGEFTQADVDNLLRVLLKSAPLYGYTQTKQELQESLDRINSPEWSPDPDAPALTAEQRESRRDELAAYYSAEIAKAPEEKPVIHGFSDSDDPKAVCGSATVDGVVYDVSIDNNLRYAQIIRRDYKYSANEPASSRADISREEAVSLADALIQELGLASMALDDAQEWEPGVWRLYYAPTVNGIRVSGVRQDHFRADGTRESYEYEYYNSSEEAKGDTVSWNMENIQIYVGSEGILSFEWYSPSGDAIVQEESASLLPFEEIAEVADTMLPVVIIGPTESRSLVELDKLSGIETRMDVTITEVSLTLMRIRDKGSSQGTIVPVWDFWGSWSWYAPGTDTSEVMQNGVSCRQPMLTLNAVDGTVVSRLFGY